MEISIKLKSFVSPCKLFLIFLTTIFTAELSTEARAEYYEYYETCDMSTIYWVEHHIQTLWNDQEKTCDKTACAQEESSC